MGIAP
jgi:hypothetical protein